MVVVSSCVIGAITTLSAPIGFDFAAVAR
jgi:hypothetical protein